MENMGRFYEDLQVGETFITSGRTVTETDIVLFGALTGDFNPIHMDEEFCKQHSIYKTRVAHGLFVLALAEGLVYRTGLFDGVRAVSLGWNNVRFVKPVFIGDTLHLEFKIVEKRESRSKPDFGIVTMLYQVKNGKNEVVLEAYHNVMVPKRRVEVE